MQRTTAALATVATLANANESIFDTTDNTDLVGAFDIFEKVIPSNLPENMDENEDPASGD